MRNADEPRIRPPMGFIVEGHGEFNCYPSLVHRIVESSGFEVPCVNAGGCGGIFRNLQRYLTNITLTRHPRSVIVTVDLWDAVRRGQAENCVELLHILKKQVELWVQVDSLCDQRLTQKPEYIVIVVQVQSFETWILSDIVSLIRAGYVDCFFDLEGEIPEELRGGIDDKILNPGSWLKKHKVSPKSLKNVDCARSIISCLDISVMKATSRSFRKFWKEVALSYQRWCEVYGFHAENTS